MYGDTLHGLVKPMVQLLSCTKAIQDELENPKSKPALEIGLWKIDRFEKVGRTISHHNDITLLIELAI
jgi:hypothetical protein